MHALFFVGKPKIKTEPLLKSARAGGTRVTLVVRVTFAKFVSFYKTSPSNWAERQDSS